MSQTNQLHWSFNHDNDRQTQLFAPQVLTALRNLPPPTHDANAHQRQATYHIWPNFWRGYKQSRDDTVGDTVGDTDIRIGHLTIQTSQDGQGQWHYAIHSTNTTSGEDQHLTFTCTDEAIRPLVGNWQIRTQNHAGHGYRQFDSQGQLATQGDDTQVMLSVNGAVLPMGKVDRTVPLTCNWTLFDSIPLLSNHLKTGDKVLLTILEDLEKLRPHSQLGYLEEWVVRFDDDIDPLHLSGYTVHGQGLLPSYWWLDQHNRIVIVGTVFQTWVLGG
ncbi:MAG: hypothetical protein AAF639_11925 [Chloroflexota bacterium]